MTAMLLDTMITERLIDLLNKYLLEHNGYPGKLTDAWMVPGSSE